MTDIIAIAASESHACALRSSDYSMWCWGENSDGEAGNHLAPAHSLVAVEVIVDNGSDSQLNVGVMAVGGKHTCAWLNDGSGTAACWGYNKLKQLGNGAAADSVNSPVPVIAPDGNDLGIDETGLIAAGYLHTCALVPEVSPHANSIACWGDNESGELGNLDAFLSWRAVPAPVVFDDGTKLTDVTSISAGSALTCALLTLDASLACWGANNLGQLGNHGLSDAYSVSPRPVTSADGTTLAGFSALSAGGIHVCAIHSDPTDPAPQPGIKCWGSNQDGELGLGSSDMNRHDVPSPVNGGWPLFTDSFDSR
jgi:alpha-tubulin suppressor-like RCC1 family protein